MSYDFFCCSNMDGLGISLAIWALKGLAFVCDVITYPVYVVLQKPWKRREMSRRIKVMSERDCESYSSDIC